MRRTKLEFWLILALAGVLCGILGYVINSGGHKEADFSAKAVSSEELNSIESLADQVVQLKAQNQNLMNILQAVVNDLNAIPDSLKHENVKNIINALTQR